MATPGQGMAAGAMKGAGFPSMGMGGPSPIMGALQTLGVQMPGGMGGMNPKQLGDTLRLAQQFKNYNKVTESGNKAPLSWNEYMADPRNQLNIVMDQFASFNRILKDRGEEEMGLFDFMQQAGVRPDIIQALASVYGGGAGAILPQQ